MKPAGDLSKPTIAALYIVLLAVVLIPVFSVGMLPLGDLPNHLARTYILNNIDADPDLQKYYAVHWKLFQFQSTDLLLPALARGLGLEAAVHLFVAAAFAVLLAGTVALHRAFFGRVGVWPATVFLFLYNFPLETGQISFLFATGLSLLVFAAWIASDTYPRVIRLLAFSLASFALLLCHFYAFAAYALLIMSFELGRINRLPTLRAKLAQLALAALPFVVPAICFLLIFGKAISGATSYGSFLSKSVALLSATFTYGDWPDLAVTIALCAGVWWLSWRKKFTFAPDMKLPTAVLIVAAAAMPRVLHGVMGADVRLPCLLAFLLVAASDVRLERRQAIGLVLGIFALVAMRVATNTAQWRRFDTDYRELRSADVVLDRGSRVLVIPAFQDLRAEPQSLIAYWFVGCLTVIDRQVFLPQLYTVATPLTFTGDGIQPEGEMPARERKVRWSPTSAAFSSADLETIRQVESVGQVISELDVYTSRVDWSDWPERFDFLIDFHMGRTGNPVPALLTEVRRGSYFTIYRIHPPQRP